MKNKSKKKILIIDDDIELCEEMSEALKDEGYFVQTAFNANKGEKLLKKIKFDIILLDYKMPGLNGIEIMKKIKDANTKVIILSGKPFIEKLLKDNNIDNQLSGIITKPFDVNELIKKLKSI